MSLGMVVELVRLGFLGFATAITILSYFLLKNLAKIPNPDPELVKHMGGQIRSFMRASLVVVFVGFSWALVETLFDPTVSIAFSVSPDDMEGYKVKLHGRDLDLLTNNIVPLKNDYTVGLDLIQLDRKIDDLSDRLVELESQAEGQANAIQVRNNAELLNKIAEGTEREEAGL